MSIRNAGLLLLAMALTPAGAAGQTAPGPPVAGAVVEGFEMVSNRTVIFEMADGGKVRILSVVDGNRNAPAPRNAGQVAAAMTYAPEIGTLLEFNNGLGYSFAYEAVLAGPPGAAPRPPETVCPVRTDTVGSESWPQPWPRIQLRAFRREDKPAAC